MAPPRFLTPYRRGTVALVFLLGLAISILAWRYALLKDAERTHAGFSSRAQTQIRVANQRLQAYREMVYSLRDAFIGQDEVSRSEFSRVGHSLLSRHVGVQSLQWVHIVPHAERAAYEQATSRELGRPFVIRRRQADGTFQPAGEDREYFVIDYLEPREGNDIAHGYDVLSAPSAPFLRSARASRQFTVSRPFSLIQSRPGQHEPGITFILPVWRMEKPDSPVQGFVQGVFLVRTMLAQSHELTTNEALDTFYFEQSPDGKPELLYANLGGREPLRETDVLADLPSPDDPSVIHTTLSIGGRSWRMLIRPNATWTRTSASRQPHAIFAAGLLISVLFTGFVNNLFRRAALVEELVQERTRQLRESETRLQDIMDHSPTLIFLKDLDGRYLLCNRAFSDFCGRPPEEIIGRRDEDIFFPEAARVVRENDIRVLQANTPMEFEESRQDPTDRRLFIAHKFPLHDQQGRAYALCGIATDITDRKAAEEQRMALERKLLEAQKLESLGVLAGGIAHDFNNILTSILGNTSLAALDLPEGHKVRRQLTQIERASQRAADLCAQMLAYAGRATFLMAPLDLSRLVQDTAALLEVSVGRRVQLDLRLAADLPAVMGDATQLRQIVMNLVINAADAMGERTDGQVIVRTFSEDVARDAFAGAIQSPQLPAGQYVGLVVADNGCGIKPEVLGRIFEPFFTTKFHGRGLGLAAVLGIVQSHDGALFVQSRPGEGTLFRLFLPATASSAPAAAPAAPSTRSSLQGTVLVVDDEEPVRTVADAALTQLGLTVRTASDGIAALDSLRSAPGSIDLVLLDLTMPGISGDEILRQLRQIRPDLRVIIMSGYSEGETMQRCASLGVTGFLPKPFTVTTLIAKLTPHLG